MLQGACLDAALLHAAARRRRRGGASAARRQATGAGARRAATPVPSQPRACLPDRPTLHGSHGPLLPAPQGCMDEYGWQPVCAYSPAYPEPTTHLPETTWVM